MRKLIFLLPLLFLTACFENIFGPTTLPSPTTVIMASPSPEASPSATAHIIIKQTVSQNGHPITEAGVEANKDFKVAGTAQCFDPSDQQIQCPFIPFWKNNQTAGFNANCTFFGSESDNYAIYNCQNPERDAVFETCALDWDKKEVGCDSVHLNIG